jgi:hypothetical protein
VAFLIVVLATLVTYPAGLAIGHPLLLPLLNTAPAYVVMALRLRRGDRQGAAVLMLVWAASLAVFGTLSFVLWPRPVDAVVLNGPAYRDEMFHWILTGQGTEGSLRLFLPQHLLHLVGFIAISLATASTASMVMGSALMNYMSFYVASLAKAGTPAWAVVFLGWQPWAICRVAAFCIFGVVLAEPLLSRLARYPYAGLRGSRKLLLWAGAGILADWVLKATLAPWWGLWLRSVVRVGGG